MDNWVSKGFVFTGKSCYTEKANRGIKEGSR